MSRTNLLSWISKISDVDPSKFKSFDGRISVSYDTMESAFRGKDTWNVDTPFYFYIGNIEDGKYVFVPKNFKTDGATVPRMFWNIIPPWGIYGNAAIVHDKLCVSKHYYVNGVPKHVDNKEIDKIFLEAMEVSGVNWIRHVLYAGVRFGDFLGFR